MRWCEEKIEKLKAMHLSNFLFWIFGKLLLGLGIGILLVAYWPGSGWLVAGWMLIVFAIIIQIPAVIAVFHKRRK